jgi:CRP-like cAMP-binding protein
MSVKKKRDFDLKAFLATIGEGRKFVFVPKKQTIFAQGDPSDAVFYIQNGKVKLTVVSNDGKEATIGILSEGDFFGEGCLAGQSRRMASATALTDAAVLRIEKSAMMRVLHREHTLSDMFVAYLLARNIRYEEIWLTNFSIRVKRGWPESFCCLPTLVRKARLRLWFLRLVRRLWQRWWALPVPELASS